MVQKEVIPFGKIVIINTLLSSQLVYKMSVLPTPSESELKEIDKVLHNYLWNNKPHKIAKSVILNGIQEGGLGMVDIYTKDIALKTAWIKRIANSNKHTISPLLDEYCKIDTHLLLKCNINTDDIGFCFKKKIPSFWFDVFKAWTKYNYVDQTEVIHPKEQIIWFNSNIKIGGQIVFIKRLFDKGITYIKDLLDENNSFYKVEELQLKYNVRIDFVTYFGLIYAISYTRNENLPVCI